MAGTATPALPQSADDLGFVPVGQSGGNQQASQQDDSDLGFTPVSSPASGGHAPDFSSGHLSQHIDTPPEAQPYTLPDGRLIDPATHTGGVPNPHAISSTQDAMLPSGTLSAAPSPSWIDRAKNYVGDSQFGRNLHTLGEEAYGFLGGGAGANPSSDAVADTMANSLRPEGAPESHSSAYLDPDRYLQSRGGANSPYKPITAVKELGTGLGNVVTGAGGGGKSAMQLLRENPSMTPEQAVAEAARQRDAGANPDLMAKGATQVMGGAMEAAKPLIVYGVAAAPIKAAIYYGAGILAGKGSAQVAQELGATPNEQEFFNTLGFFIPGTLTSLAGLKTASIPEGTTVMDPVTGDKVPVRGGVVGTKNAVAAGVARSDTGGYAGQVRVGPYSVGVKFGRNAPEAPGGPAQPQMESGGPQGSPVEPPSAAAIQQRAQSATVAEAAANAAAINLKAAQIVGMAPPPPPPPKPGEPGSKQAPPPAGVTEGHISQQAMSDLGSGISQLPPTAQPKAVLEATGKLAKVMFDAKTIIGPDNKVVNVDSQKAAQTEAVNLVNDQVEKKQQEAEESAKAQKEQQDSQNKALEQQQKDAETAAAEREEARAAAEKNEVHPLPDTPQMQSVRKALNTLPADAPKADVILAARKAAGTVKMLLPYKLASQLADEHLATRAQQEDAAVAGITGQDSNPDQHPVALSKLATDVKEGKTAFLHVQPTTKFKPAELNKENGFVSTVVKKAQDSTFNGQYFHPAAIKSKDVKLAASGEAPLAALRTLEAQWKRNSLPADAKLGGAAEDFPVSTGGTITERPKGRRDVNDRLAEGKVIHTLQAEGYGTEIRIVKTDDPDTPYYVVEFDPKTGERTDLNPQGFDNLKAAAEKARELAAEKPETKAPEPETPKPVVETKAEPIDEVQLYREARTAALARGIDPRTTEEWGTAIADEEARILAERNSSNRVAKSEVVHESKEVALNKKLSARTYEEVQKEIDAEENRLEASGQQVTKLYFPEHAEGPGGLKNAPGWKPMPENLVRLYAERDAIGSGQLEQSIAEIENALKKTGVTDEAEMRRVLEYYALDKSRTDAAKQYMASEYTMETVNRDPKRQAADIYSALAPLRDVFMDDRDDLWRDRKLTKDSIAVVKAVVEYFNGGNPVEIKGILPETIQSNPVQLPKRPVLKPGQKVTVRASDGTQRSAEVRFTNPGGKVILKGERKPVAVGDVSPAEEAAAKEGKSKLAELLTGEEGGIDPAVFQKYVGEPLMKMAEPLRQELAERGHVADVANDVHDQLQNLDRTNRATTLEAKALTRKMKEAGFSNEDGKAVFKNLEDPAVPLDEKQIELRDEWIKPLNQHTRFQYAVTKLIESGKFELDVILEGKVPEEEVNKIVPPQDGYQHRIPVERDTFVDKLLGDSLKRFRAPGNVLSRIFPSAKRSILKEIHGPDGEREVVAVKNGRVTQFINKDNAEVLDRQITAAQDKLAKAKVEGPNDVQRLKELQTDLDDLNAKKAEIASAGHTVVDMGAHLHGYVSTDKLADEAVAPLEAKLADMKKEFSVLHGSQKRAIASQQRIENLYYQIDNTEKQIAAVRASVGPKQEGQEGITRDQALQERLKPLQDQIQRITEKQADLAKRETNTRWGQRQLKSLPDRIQDLKDRMDAVTEEMAGQGLEGNYWRDKNGGLWKFDRGTTEFISERSGQEYHADARLAALVNYMEVNKGMNAAVVLERAKGMLEAENMAMKTDNSKDVPDGWKPTYLQQMRGYYFPAHVADAFDQFDYLQQRGAPNIFQMANNFVIQSVLMNPLYHGLNIGSNWFAGKEGEALAGSGIKPSWYTDQVKAGIEAANMMKDWGGPEYQRLLRLGLDLRGADAGFDVQTKAILRSFTDQLDADKPSNAVMSALIGVKNGAQFMQRMNHQITFGMGDLALAQAFYAKRAELLREGVPNAEQAARDWAHRMVGEYTTPVRLAGSAGLGRVAENPLAQSFFRYHFGYILRPLATAVRESVGDFKPDEEASQASGKNVNEFNQSPAAARALAIARLAALVIMATYVFPKLLDKAAKAITNDERARAPRGGLFKFASDAYETATGERSIASLAGSVFTPGLGPIEAVQLGANRDNFSGRHIYGSDQDPEGKAKQIGAWLVKGTLPGQTAARMDQSGLRQVVEGLVGFKFPIEHGIKAAVEIRRDEGGSNPPDLAKTRVFQSIMAAAEQSHRTQGQDTSLHDALLASGKLSAPERKTLREAIHEAPIVFATRGLEHPQDYYRVFEHSTDAEKSALIHDHETLHKLNLYQKELRSEGKADQADKILAEIRK